MFHILDPTQFQPLDFYYLVLLNAQKSPVSLGNKMCFKNMSHKLRNVEKKPKR